MNPRTPSPLHVGPSPGPRRCGARVLAWLLAGVLALAPFLHGHFGIAHESGFHIDGLHALQHAGQDTLPSLQADDDESPALGVTAVHPPSEDGGVLWWPVALALTLLPLAPLLRESPRPAPEEPARTPPRWRAGLPPPSLAPPTA